VAGHDRPRAISLSGHPAECIDIKRRGKRQRGWLRALRESVCRPPRLVA